MRAGRVYLAQKGRQPTWMWSSWSLIANVLSAPWKVISEMIWWGFMVPWSLSSAWMVMSVIEPGPGRPALLDSYADHRMVHAGAVLGLAIDGVEVADPGAVSKTLPDFVERWNALLGDPVGVPH